MSPKKLGRGLDSLIPRMVQPVETPQPQAEAEATPAAPAEAGETTTDSDRVLQIDPKSIRVNRDQPRTHFEESAIDELAHSIRQNGILQPLVVHQTADGYELIAGERRLRASQKLELARVPVIVRHAASPDLLELALIENIQREDLNPVETALAYQNLRDQHGWTQAELAERLGKKRSSVANVLRFLELPQAIQAGLAAGQITPGHAKVLLTVAADQQIKLFEATVAEQLTVRSLESRWDQIQNPAQPEPASSAPPPPKKSGSSPAEPKPPHIVEQEDMLSRALGTKVEIRESGGRGKVTIDFYSLEEYEALRRRLVASPQG